MLIRNVLLAAMIFSVKEHFIFIVGNYGCSQSEKTPRNEMKLKENDSFLKDNEYGAF